MSSSRVEAKRGVERRGVVGGRPGGFYVGEGEFRDGGDALGVEEDQQSGDTVGGV